MNYPMVKKNQRVWNGKWYSTVAYRGNLYYKLPWCTEAEPQIALSFSLCMSLYAQCILRRCARKSLVCVFWVCLVSFFWYQVNDSHVSQFCASMLLRTYTHWYTHTHTRRDTCTLCLVLSLCMSPVQIPIRVKIRHVFVIDQIIPLSLSLTLTQPYTQHTQS